MFNYVEIGLSVKVNTKLLFLSPGGATQITSNFLRSLRVDNVYNVTSLK